MNIILIGYRGTGKTTVAKSLAARLGWPWCDADQVIEQTAGRSIAEIFAAEGEPAFRQLETDALQRLVAGDRQVLALGGGAVLRTENRQLLAAAGPVVWLKAVAETIYNRLAADPKTAGQRPNLTPGGGMQEIRDLLAEREPVYQQCATLQVDTEHKDPAAVVDEIMAGIAHLL